MHDAAHGFAIPKAWAGSHVPRADRDSAIHMLDFYGELFPDVARAERSSLRSTPGGGCELSE